jgi:hypothetical protein
MNNTPLYKIAFLLYKKSQNLSFGLSDEIKIENLTSHMNVLKNKIEIIETSQKVFQNQTSNKVPVCLLEVGYLLKTFTSEPALLFRFGNFQEQPYDNPSKQIKYVSNLISQIDFIESYNISSVSAGDVKSSIKNSAYNMYVAVTFAE